MEFLQQNWYWAALAAVSGAWLMADLIRNHGDKSQLSPVEATLLVNREDAVIIDVREQGEYAQGHIPNARHIPLGELERRSKELEKWKTHPVILCCATGARSGTAIKQLKQAGFEKLFNLRGGMMEWQKAGQPVSRKRK
ncbi:rhodanese-like domain-containing protein [Thauera sp. WH-1]|uniref:rhodanese-like domain-containing protein n=1 Tax=Thauera sp. WH-1 TaxID=3398230 RepID=UPI0039FB91D8